MTTHVRVLAVFVSLLPIAGSLAEEIEIRGARSIRLGDYVIELDGATTAWIDTDAGTVRLGRGGVPDAPNPPNPPDPTDPPTPKPSPGIESLEQSARTACADIPDAERVWIAATFRAIKIGPTAEASNERELGLLTSERLRHVLGSGAAKVRPSIEQIFDAANKLRDAGKIVTIDDWSKAWQTIAKGVDP